MRKSLRLSLLPALILLLTAAANAQTVLRLNELGPEAGPEAAALRAFKDTVEVATQGSVKIELHYAASLGNPSTSLEAMMSGELDLFSGDLRYMLPVIIDEVTGLDLPFLVPSNAAARNYLASPLFNEGREKVILYRHIRILETDAFRGPERMMAVTRKVTSLEDLRGLRLAVFPGPTKAGVQLWRALGVTVLDTAWPDVRSALDRHLIDGVIAPDLGSLIAARIPRVAPFIGPSHDHPQIWQIAIFDGAWRKLDASQQAAVAKAAAEAASVYNHTAKEAMNRDLAAVHANKAAVPVSIDPLLAHERLRAGYAELISQGATSPRVRDTANAAITQSGVALLPYPVAAGQEFRDCPTCPVMVVVPAGAFVMGSPPSEKGRFDNEGPQRTVVVSHPFAVAKFPVTMGQLRAWQPGRGPDPIDDDPAVMITWTDAGQYAAWLSEKTGRHYHLPTEAEYEYVERAGTKSPYYWGDSIGLNNANCFGCGSRWDGKGSAPVGSFPPNKFGLHDMTGNVFEWVQDCYSDSEADAPTDVFVAREAPDGKCAQRTLRASSWFNLPTFLRSAYRFHESPESKNSRRSFRLVVD